MLIAYDSDLTNIKQAGMNKVIYDVEFPDSHLCSGIKSNLRNIGCAMLLMVVSAFSYGQYCLPTYQTPSCTSGDYISGVQFNAINSQNNVCAGSGPNYGDYTGNCTNVCPGSSYQITITNNANNGEYMAVCIDFNQNDDFSDPGEFFPIGYAQPGANISANIIIPRSASPGGSVLRVFCQGANIALTQSDVCGNLTTGEVQDYCLNINQPVVINLGGNITQCGGGVTLDAGNAGATYAWSDGSSSETLAVSTSGTYSTTVTDTNACSASSSVNVYIKPVPVVALGPNVSQCGGTVTLNAGNTGQNFFWSDSETTQTILVSATGAYSVTVTNVNSSCTASGSIQVTIDTVPVVGFNTFAPKCGGYDTLDAGNFGSTYRWSDGSTNETLIVASSGNYWVTVTDGNNCTASAQGNVTINPLPNVTLNIQANVCNTIANFKLYGGAPTGGTYYVDYIADTSFNTIDAGIQGHQVTYIYSDTLGCTDSATTYITVRQHPFITTLDFPATCSGSATINLDDYFTPAGGVYSGLGVSTHYFYPPLSGAGTDTIIDIVTDSYGCIDTSIFPVTVNASVKVTLAPSVLTNAICAGQTVSFTATGADNYQFFVNGTSQGNMSSNSNFSTFALQNNDVVTVVGTNTCSADTSLPVGFNVYPLPLVSAGNDTSIALGQSLQLNAVASGTGLLVYQWSPASQLNVSNIPNPIYSGTDDSTVFTVVVSDTYGCVDTSHITVHIFVPDAVQLPNIITPDGNGKNDTWKVNSRVDLTGSKLVIFNRWGETVYYADSYNNDWGGTYKNTGEKLPDGTYYYEFKVPSQNNHLYKGAINILNGGAK